MASLFLLAMPGAPSSVLALSSKGQEPLLASLFPGAFSSVLSPSSKARSPY